VQEKIFKRNIIDNINKIKCYQQLSTDERRSIYWCWSLSPKSR